MNDAVSFYTSRVAHRRHGKVSHKLAYRIAYALIDLDRLGEGNAQSRWFGVNAGGLMSFRARDHGDGQASDLAEWVRGLLRRRGVEAQATRIELLTMPRMFGFVFNPISFYFIYDAHGGLHHILYEVNNTFGGRHFYLCPTKPHDEVHRHQCDKRFHVSPFFDVEGDYSFAVRAPEERFDVAIKYVKHDGSKAMTAQLQAARHPVTSATSLRLLAAYPFMTLGVVAAIHWEALKLFVKGAKYHPCPKEDEEVAAGVVREVLS